jgi:hypothetical protein
MNFPSNEMSWKQSFHAMSCPHDWDMPSGEMGRRSLARLKELLAVVSSDPLLST